MLTPFTFPCSPPLVTERSTLWTDSLCVPSSSAPPPFS